MIQELGQQRLDPLVWGAKASRLSTLYRHGFIVPQSLLVQSSAIAGQLSSDAIASWLRVHRPNRVAVRVSLADEDGTLAANAGKGTSILNCPPSADAVLRVAREALSDSRGCTALAFIIQRQVRAALGGVAFRSESRVTIEAAINSTTKITSGLAPDILIDIAQSAMTIRGNQSATGLPILQLVRDLERVSGQAAEIFDFALDIEWAWSEGILHLLQIRPITRTVWKEANE